MEKVKIKSASGINDKLIKVELEDGRNGSSYDRGLLEKVGQDVELIVKPGNVYQGEQQYFFNSPKKSGGFSKRDYTSEKRIAALNAASRFQGIPSDDVIKLSEKYFKWLNE